MFSALNVLVQMDFAVLLSMFALGLSGTVALCGLVLHTVKAHRR